MSRRYLALALVCLATLCAAPSWALDGRKPGSVLIYPIQRAGLGAAAQEAPVFTILSVTNTALEVMNQQTLGGATSVHWDFLNTLENPNDPLNPYACTVQDRGDFLTPADTTSFLAGCWNPGNGAGFAVVSAQDPNFFDVDWSHNFLVGSECVIDSFGSVYCLNAIPFTSPQTRGSHTDNDDPFAGVGDGAGDGDGQLDFDGREYEGVPDHLYGEFIADPGTTLTLLNLSGGAYFTASVAFDIFNDNEYPLSLQLQFRCWFSEPLESLSNVFTLQHLAFNTPDDPTELDIDCDGVNDRETGWFRIRGLNYSSVVDTCLNPALLGSITMGAPVSGLPVGGHLLWESKEKQFNGDFYKFSTDDPECPEDIDQPPVCDPGPDQVVQLGDPVTVDGSNSMDPDGMIVSYMWDFMDGNTANTAVAMNTYAAPGTYFAKLTVVDDDGLMAMCTVTIKVNEPPVCDAGPDVDIAPGGTANFDGSNSFDNDGTVVRYDWDYGDGSPVDVDAGPTPSHVYAAPGVYNVKLTVFDNDGGMSMCFTQVTVNVPPICDAGGPYSGDIGVPVNFDGSGSSDPDGTIVQYDWDYGDGSPVDVDAGATPSHTYNTGGTFNGTLTVTDDDGTSISCPFTVEINLPPICDAGGPYFALVGEKVMFDGSNSSDPDGVIVTYDWLLGDGMGQQLDVGPTPMTTYNTPGVKNVILKVTDDDGNSVNCPTTVTVNAPPVCDAGTADPTQAFVGENIDFDGSASMDPDGTIVSYVWDFGDGGMGAGAMTSHSYADPGMYEVTLTVTDDDGAMTTCTTDVEILNQLPICDAGTASPSVAGIGDRIMFNGSASSDPDGVIVSYVWDFGDGMMGNGAMPVHAYNMGGTFDVKLTVTDDDGGMSMCFTQVSINLPPVCDAGGPYMASLFVPIDFDGSASSDPDGTIVQYDWDYGDGTPLDVNAGPMPSHLYTDAGQYTVTLTVTDDDGSTATCDVLVEIFDVSGALAFSGDDPEEHCQSILCGAYVSSLMQWCLDNGNNAGTGILAIGVQPNNLPVFFSVALQAFNSWITLLDNPATPVTFVNTVAELQGVDFDDYELIFIPSFEQHIAGGIKQELLNELFVMKDELADYTLNRGGSLLVLTQAEDDDFVPPIQNGYTWSPIPFTSDSQRYFFVEPTAFALNGGPGFTAPLPGATGAGISHEAWHNTFLPDGILGFSGLQVLVTGNELGVRGEAAIIGGVPIVPIPSTNMSDPHHLPNAGKGHGPQRRGHAKHPLSAGPR